MSGTTNHWKLGLFVVLGSLTLVATLVGLGAARLERETVESISYFDTDVHGLVVGAPVNFRGVAIGQVASIGFAPDQRHVKVTQTIYVDALRELGLSDQAVDPEVGPFVPPDLRVRLESSILTGVAFIEGDFIDLARYPVPEYPFPTPWNTVHAVPSTFESLEGGLVATLDQLPQLLAEGTAAIKELRATVTELEIGETQSRVNRLLDQVEQKLANFEGSPLVTQGLRTFEEMEAGLREFRILASELRKEEGPMLTLIDDYSRLSQTLESTVTASDLPGTTAAFRSASAEVGEGTQQLGLLLEDVRRDLEEVRATLEAFRDLADTLERDPSSLLYGRTPSSPLSGD